MRESDVQIFETTDGQRVQFGGWQLKRVDGRPEAIEFLEELEVDAAYTVEVHHECTEVPTALEFRVGQRASLPTELGRLQAVAERRQVSRFGGFSCEDVAFDAVFVTVSMEWAEDALPWRDLIRWNISSGEKVLYGLGPGDTKPLFLPCETAGFGELSEGDSELIARAVLPGTDVELESAATSLQVSCERSSSTDGSVFLGNDAGLDEYAPPAPGCRLGVPGSAEAERHWLWLFGLLVCALRLRRRLARA